MTKTSVSFPEPHLEYERVFLAQGYRLIAGLDEAGRGALAGPVVAAAVVLPLEDTRLRAMLRGVRDSKLCTPAEREALYGAIVQAATTAAPGIVGVDEIDRMGIGAATRLAMRRALEDLIPKPEALLIDWVRLPDVNLPQQCFAKGDQLSLSVAAASIIAKVTRDRLMVDLDADYSGYGFAQHKGYGTPEHQSAITRLGPCKIHRLSFNPIRTRLFGEANRADRACS